MKKYQVKKRLGKKTGGAGYRKKAATKKTASETVSKKSWSKAEKKAAKQAVLAERKRQKKDEFGNVLVNVARPAEDDAIHLAPQLSRVFKPHQIGGIR